jgi:hypothetical protein
VAWEPGDRFHLLADGRLDIGRTTARMRWPSAVAAARAGGVRVSLGREPRWWGPGTLTEMILTNNAPAGDGIEIATDGTKRLPLVGPCRFSIFLVHLDDRHRPTKNPLLFGHRTAWRPIPALELGAERTIMLGGDGRTERYQLSDLWDIFLGRRENRRGYGGHEDTDQKVGVDASLYLHPIAGAVPPLRGGRIYFRYGGDDAFKGLLPTRAAHLYGLTLLFPRTRLEALYFEAVADGLWYWNSEYPAGYTYRGDFLGSELGWDSKTLRGRLTLALARDVGLRLDLVRDSRGHRFHQGPGLEPERGASVARAVEAGAALTRRLGGGARITLEYRYRNPDGFAYDRDRTFPRHVGTVTVRVV